MLHPMSHNQCSPEQFSIGEQCDSHRNNYINGIKLIQARYELQQAAHSTIRVEFAFFE